LSTLLVRRADLPITMDAQRREITGGGLHTHLAENHDDIDCTRESFGCTPAEYAEPLGWLGPDVWHAHCVKLDAAGGAGRRRLGQQRQRPPAGRGAAGPAAAARGFRRHGDAGALQDPVAALLLCHAPALRLNVVNGRVRVRDGQLTAVELAALVARHNRLAARPFAAA